MRFRYSLATALTSTLAGLSAHAGIVNGSFEADAQTAGSWSIYSSLSGWQGGNQGIELRNGVAGAAQDGNNYVELDTRGNSGMWQTVATQAGQNYELSIWFSPRIGVKADSNDIQVWWDASMLGTLNGSGVGASGHVWRPVSFQVTGSGSNTLRFMAAGVSDSYGGSLDNVRLNAVSAPGSLALVLGGLMVAGVVLRRR